MTIPTKNLAIQNAIVTGVFVFVMGLPRTQSSSPLIFPYKWVVTSFACMLAVVSFALTAITSGFKANFNRTIRKCHIVPPCKGRGNDYSTMPANVKPLSNRRWWGRIVVWEDTGGGHLTKQPNNQRWLCVLIVGIAMWTKLGSEKMGKVLSGGIGDAFQR